MPYSADYEIGTIFGKKADGTFARCIANMECVGTYGQELYARQLVRDDGTGIDISIQSNPLPMVKRPALTVRLHSSN